MKPCLVLDVPCQWQDSTQAVRDKLVTDHSGNRPSPWSYYRSLPWPGLP